MNTKIFCTLAWVALGSAPAWADTCYTAVGSNNEVIYQSWEAPVDMAKPLHQTVPGAFPQGTLLHFGITSDDCPAIDKIPPAAQKTASVRAKKAKKSRRSRRAAAAG